MLNDLDYAILTIHLVILIILTDIEISLLLIRTHVNVAIPV